MSADPRELSRRQLARRDFLHMGLLAGVGLPLLEACGSSKKSTGSTAPAASGSASASSSGSAAAAASFGTLSYRLSWIKNVEFAGTYIADQKGYFKQAGFSGVSLISGGPSATPQETDVVTGKAFIGISSPDITGAAVAKGAPLKIVGAQYQKNPFAVMSLTKKPIKTPQDMYGKKIGVQATNESVWTAFLKAANLDASKIHKVPVQFDPLPLTQGVVDGWFSFVTNEPNDLRMKGFDVTTFLLADFNYPLVSETYMVTTDSLTKDREKIKAALKADIRGWKESLANPVTGATLAADTYGKGLGLSAAEQTLESKSQNALILTPDTTKNGLFTITPELLAANIKTLTFAGVNVTQDKLFDMSLLEEVYKENPSLV